MVEHHDQPCLLGFRVRFPAGAFAILSVSAEASVTSNIPFSFPSSSFPSPFDLLRALNNAVFALIP